MDYFFNSSFFQSQSPLFTFLYFVIIAWSFFWKGLALWHCAQNRQKYWFVALLVLNTLGIVEVVYLFYFAKKRYTAKTFVALFKK